MSRITQADLIDFARRDLAEARKTTHPMSFRVQSYLRAWVFSGDIDSTGRYGKEASQIRDAVETELTALAEGRRRNPSKQRLMRA